MDNISKIHGLSLTAWAIAGLVGNQISSITHSIFGNYTPVLLILTCIYSIAMIVSISLRKKLSVLK